MKHMKIIIKQAYNNPCLSCTNKSFFSERELAQVEVGMTMRCILWMGGLKEHGGEKIRHLRQ
jgi:hypothetical protein